MKSSTIFLLLAAMTAAASDYTLTVQDFSELRVVDGVNVIYKESADSAGTVRFSADGDLASKLTFTNHKDRLTIQTLADETPIPGMPTVTVYSNGVSLIQNDGDSLTTVTLKTPVRNLKIKQIGNGAIDVRGISADRLEAVIATGCGKIDLQGKAKEAKYSNIGTGRLDAGDVEAGKVSAFIMGSGPVEVFTDGELTAKGIGPGRVLYVGTPSKIRNRSLGVRIITLAEE